MFDIPLLINLFISLIEHPVKTSNKGTHIPLLINLFVSLSVFLKNFGKFLFFFDILISFEKIFPGNICIEILIGSA